MLFPISHVHATKILTEIFKNLGRVLQAWTIANISSLSSTIAKIKPDIDFLDIMEESRDLSLEEWILSVS
jgi:hypothetical protein